MSLPDSVVRHGRPSRCSLIGTVSDALDLRSTETTKRPSPNRGHGRARIKLGHLECLRVSLNFPKVVAIDHGMVVHLCVPPHFSRNRPPDTAPPQAAAHGAGTAAPFSARAGMFERWSGCRLAKQPDRGHRAHPSHPALSHPTIPTAGRWPASAPPAGMQPHAPPDR